MKRWLGRPWFWLCVLVLGALVTLAGWRAGGPAVRAVVVARHDVEQHVVASGRVWVPSRVNVSAQTPGLVIGVAVVEGRTQLV